MTDDRARIDRQAASSAAAAIWRALAPLRSVLSFYQTGAHPDDETSKLLARLALKDGVRVGYVCAVRGEGGQNAVGTEMRNELGVLRTAEMAAASRVFDIDVHWLSDRFDDPVFDFGFSKAAPETFAAWGEERVVGRLVRAIRAARPDAVCPTFLDVPGQHGHHRAMTQAAIRAFDLAGDPAAFPEHAAEGLAPWRPKLLYLPAWSGAGDSYDDETPPPNATVAVEVGETDPVLGATYAQIGQWSRRFHASQGMGTWVDPKPEAVPLHRLRAVPGLPEDGTDPFAGLPRTLGDLGAAVGGACGAALAEAQAAVDGAFAAYPDAPAVADACLRALDAVRRARAVLPDAHADEAGHRLALKERQLSRAVAAASLVQARLTVEPARAAPGATVSAVLSVHGVPAGTEAALDLVVPEGWRVSAPAEDALPGGRTARFAVAVPEDAPFHRPYRWRMDPTEPSGPVAGVLRLARGGVAAEVPVEAEEDLLVLPPASVEPTPATGLVNLERPRPVETTVAVRALGAGGRVRVAVDAADGWRADGAGAELALDPGGTAAAALRLVPPAGLAEGLASFPVRVEGDLPSSSAVREAAHPHIRRTAAATPSVLRVRTLRAALPEGVRIGYVDGGSDRAWQGLRLLGLEVEMLGPDRVRAGDFAGLETIVVGIFAFRTRPELAAAAPRLRAWTEAGGTLVTQYHRPWDAWDPDATPPRRIRIGSPSLRWRVTDQASAVEHLVPDHPLLTTPNRIGPEDWAGWAKERGLYFPSEWDPAYAPLVSMADPGEAPHRSALLAADVGLGRHVHCSLVLHTQMEFLVPGAFRLFANLVAPRARAA
jgi:LmbE family N-acetylglucosaminyl deacetylase